MKYKRIAIDTSKAVFTLHGIDQDDRVILRRDLRRDKFLAFFENLPPTELAIEACGGSHHWGRELGRMGHRVLLIPPQYVKPFVKRGKNDRNDAEAICEAAGRPNMRFVPVKTEAQQADAMLLGVRELLVRQRTQLVNALRGHASEFGIIAARGIERVEPLLERIAQCAALPCAALPAPARQALGVIGEEIARLDLRLDELDRQLTVQYKANPVSRLLEGIPGVGKITALTIASRVDPKHFKSGRHFAAWLGLTPKERSTGGRQRLGGISREGNERMRQLLVVGAMALIRHARPGSKTASPLMLKLLERRRPRKLVAVAHANKMARTVWAMLTSGEAYRAPRLPVAA
jgi:transposase